MLFSRLVHFTRFCSKNLSPQFTLFRYYVNPMFDVFPTSKLFDVVDKKKVQAKYSEFEELKNAPEKVKKVLSVEFGYVEDFLNEAIHELVAQIQPDKETFDKVFNIVTQTVKLKYMHESYKRTERKFYRLQSVSLAKEREDSLNDLRDSHFEIYAKTVKILGLHHYFEPQYPFSRTDLADEVADMRIRAFAESRRLTALENKRKQELFDLKKKYVEDIMHEKFKE